LKDKKCCIDKEVGTRGMIVNPSEMRFTHSRAQAMKDSVEDLEACRSKPE
jgi:hypothetical protein